VRKIIYILLFICCNSLFAQKQKQLDSLRLVYKNSTDSKEKLYALNKLCNKTRYSDFETSIIYGKKGIDLAKQLKNVSTEAEIHNDLGLAYMNKSYFDKAFKELNTAENLFRELENEEMVGVVFNNFGLLFNRKNDYGKELMYHHQALDIFEKLDLPKRKAMSYVNIGKVYVVKKDHKTAADFFIKAYQIYSQLEDNNRVVTCLNNIAAVYMYTGDNELSNLYFNKNLELLETLEDVDREKAMVLYNSSGALMNMKKYDEAEARLTEALFLCKKLDDKESLSICYHNFGVLYLEKKGFKAAKYNFIQSLELCKQINIRELEIENYRYLAQVYENTGEFEKAYKNYTHYAAIKDSIFNKQVENINEVEKKYLEEKTAREIEAMNIAKQEEEHQSKIIKIISGASVLILVLIIVSVVFKYRDKKKSNLLLEVKNKEITDSIKYAKRIQSAILPADKVIEENLQESFILYKPKDIVAGDFYWMEQKAGKVLFAAADCTGHGVPGAMASVVCNNALNRSVREHGLTVPGEILNKTREIVIAEFEKSDEEVKDGMDIALCSLDGKNLQYAGAHNPLWIIRNGEIIETKANKQPIGQFDNPEPYTTHLFELEKGDSIYIFSDGYVDQFGGEKGKKFKVKSFRELLLSVQDKSMEEQKAIIDTSFENWRGDLEQIDDVCVIGIRI
jgi:serine phosphatase RsbU (regulator of sigma subunit)/Tfp pilus assembly protein PilF